uniref:Uncharacterized protein n=1 Tax=Lepeophtheirus salmonis TaxID=72036 RepID=A0A0K2UZW9_LEPSM
MSEDFVKKTCLVFCGQGDHFEK